MIGRTCVHVGNVNPRGNNAERSKQWPRQPQLWRIGGGHDAGTEIIPAPLVPTGSGVTQPAHVDYVYRHRGLMDKTCARVSRVGASDFATVVTLALTNAAGHRLQSQASTHSKHGNNPTIHSITRRSVYHPTESQTHTSTTHVAQGTDDLVARLFPITSLLLTSTAPRPSCYLQTRSALVQTPQPGNNAE